MKDPLKRFTIAATGDFGPQRSHEKIRQWVEANGGTFAFNITPKVTHLICSRQHFKRSVTMVREARTIDGLSIVTFDWLEDSLMKMYARKETGYLLRRQERASAKVKKTQKAVRKQTTRKVKAFEKSCREIQREMFSDGYHVYRDSTTFAYDITLARAKLISNQNERYHVKLCESHTEPSLYSTYIKFTSPGHRSTTRVLAPIGSSFETAFDAFTAFFRSVTGTVWARRFGDGEAEGEEGHKEGKEGGGKVFVYTPPGKGEPRGL